MSTDHHNCTEPWGDLLLHSQHPHAKYFLHLWGQKGDGQKGDGQKGDGYKGDGYKGDGYKGDGQKAEEV